MRGERQEGRGERQEGILATKSTKGTKGEPRVGAMAPCSPKKVRGERQEGRGETMDITHLGRYCIILQADHLLSFC